MLPINYVQLNNCIIFSTMVIQPKAKRRDCRKQFTMFYRGLQYFEIKDRIEDVKGSCGKTSEGKTNRELL